MEQFAPYIGMAFVVLGSIGVAVGAWRIVLACRRNGGRADQTTMSDR